jgi:hypothetical protein
MILVAFILFAALIAAWLTVPGDGKVTIAAPALQPVASPAD